MSWKEQVNQVSKEVQAEFGDLSNVQIYIRTEPNKWSVAENLQHLIQVNESYFPIFERLEKETFQHAFIGKFEFFRNLFGNMIYQSVADGGKKKVKTFPLWEPKFNDKDEDVIEKFLQHQETLKNWIEILQPWIEKDAVIHSPANKIIVYTLPKALDIIVAHERRHLEQAKKAL
jgi:hypothetical protein